MESVFILLQLLAVHIATCKARLGLEYGAPEQSATAHNAERECTQRPCTNVLQPKAPGCPLRFSFALLFYKGTVFTKQC